MKRDAIRYAESGFHVLPLYTVVTTDSGERSCSCGNNGCRSVGKHPRADLAPRGVHDATDDVDEILGGWPEGGYNIGLALEANLVAFDIDDSDVARRLLDSPDLLDSICLSITRRGVHCIVRTTEGTRSGIIKHSNGQRIGEIRAEGEYIVVPPSKHAGGSAYYWLRRSLFEFIPVHEGDGWGYARELLSELGVTVAEHNNAIQVDAVNGEIPPIDLPFNPPTDAMKLQQLLTGTYPTNDRSETLYALACEVYRQGALLGVTVDPKDVAGVIRKVDSVYYHKFAGRSDEIQRVWECSVRAQADVAAEMQTALVPAAQAPLVLGPVQPQAQAQQTASQVTYAYDSQSGFLMRSGRTPIRLANFEPVIAEELDVWLGEGNRSTEWVVEMRKDDELRTATLDPSDFEEERAISRALSREMPTDYIVEPKQWSQLIAGMKWYSIGKTVRRTSYGVTGWLPDRDAFLLPSAGGVITASGIDPTIQFESRDAPVRLLQYGLGVQPPNDDVSPVLQDLIRIIPPRVLMPLISQALAAPLASLGIDRERTVLHLFGKTGSYKTSLARAILSLYGQFYDGQNALDSWIGTAASFELSANQTRDLPLVIDDYKVSSLRGRGGAGEQAAISFIQGYADGTVRSRMNSRQREHKRLSPRCLLITTGEDVWETHQSALARTLIVETLRSEISFDDIVHLGTLAQSGRMAQLGYLWLAWLCRMGRETLKVQIAARRDTARERVAATELSAEHPRLVSAMANLMAVSTLFNDFVADQFPAISGDMKHISREGWAWTFVAAARQAAQARELSPFQQLSTAINEGIALGEVRLAGRTKGTPGYGDPLARPIGYIDLRGVYLSSRTTFGWFLERRAREGQSVGFSWAAVVQEATRENEARSEPMFIFDEKQRARLLCIPLFVLGSGYLEELSALSSD